MVYVLNKEGKPLMPTKRHGKVKHLLREGKAKVVSRCPFTIKLTADCPGYTQPITLGVDAGSKKIGLSATTQSEELYAAEVYLRTDVSENISTRRDFRSARRYRKTRYRKARFSNRKREKGWLAPSIRQKIDTHLKAVADVHKILPISHVIAEIAAFDIHKIKNPDIKGSDYQKGEQLGFWNVREYILFRDGHICQHCKGKSKDPILNVHHIESRRTGGDAPNNLVTLCETCHKKYHNGEIKLNFKRGMRSADATFMGIMRGAFYEKLQESYPSVELTYGYLTKTARISNALEKSHCVDARCISGNPTAIPTAEYYLQKAVRRRNRQLHKAKFLKGGRRKNNQLPRVIYGFRLYDMVRYDGVDCFIFGRRLRGYFDVRLLDGNRIHDGAKVEDLKLLANARTLLTERRVRCSSPHI